MLVTILWTVLILGIHGNAVEPLDKQVKDLTTKVQNFNEIVDRLEHQLGEKTVEIR